MRRFITLLLLAVSLAIPTVALTSAPAYADCGTWHTISSTGHDFNPDGDQKWNYYIRVHLRECNAGTPVRQDDDVAQVAWIETVMNHVSGSGCGLGQGVYIDDMRSNPNVLSDWNPGERNHPGACADWTERWNSPDPYENVNAWESAASRCLSSTWTIVRDSTVGYPDLQYDVPGDPGICVIYP